MSPGALRRGLAAAALAAIAGGGAGVWWVAERRAPVTHTVRIDATRYEPQRLVIREGDTVVWVNEDLLPHTVTATGRAFDSEVLVQGARWRFTAQAAGDFDYACTFHPTMTGRLEVR
jgi:plastocyanin